jgi:hypothetical protein
MLNALMGGQSLTATELAYCANVSRSTAGGHLSKLVAARPVKDGAIHRARLSFGSRFRSEAGIQRAVLVEPDL